MSILVVGSISKDLIIKMPKMPAINEEAFCEEGEYFHGGAGANVAAILSSVFNLETYLLSCVGNDQMGDELLERIEASGVNTNFIKKIENSKTTKHIIFTDFDDNRVTFVFSGAMKHLKSEDLPKNLLSNIYLAPTRPDTAYDLLKSIVDLDYRLFFNPGSAFFGNLKLLNELLPRVNCLILNDKELREYTGSDDLFVSAKGILLKGVHTLFVTLGSKGAIVFEDKYYCFRPSYKSQIVNTVGCGDAFAGAAVASLLTKGSIIEALDMGNAIGGIVAEQAGMRNKLPSIDDVKVFRANTKLNDSVDLFEAKYFKPIS